MPPGETVTLEGVAPMVKSGELEALTTKVTVVLWLREPLVPVMVSVYEPAGVVVEVVTVRVEVPEPATEVGLNTPVVPEGRPLTPNVTVPVNPFNGATVAV